MANGVIKALSGNKGQHVSSPGCCRGGNTVLWVAFHSYAEGKHTKCDSVMAYTVGLKNVIRAPY